MNTPAGVECIHWPNFGEPLVGSIVVADRIGVWNTMKPVGAKQYRISRIPLQEKYRSKFPEDVVAAVGQLVGYVDLTDVPEKTGRRSSTRTRKAAAEGKAAARRQSRKGVTSGRKEAS
jgi:hypothetical protein